MLFRSRRFGKKGKLSPWFVGPFKILQKVGEVAYKLELPENMKGIHNVFHVSMLTKHLRDGSDEQILDTLDLALDPDVTFIQHPVQILARDVRKTRRSEVPFVKVKWSSSDPQDTSWVMEEEMKLLCKGNT